MSNKIIDYTVVIASSPTSLIEKVRDMNYKGWQPFGGICIDGDSDYFQAMVIYAEQ